MVRFFEKFDPMYASFFIISGLGRLNPRLIFIVYPSSALLCECNWPFSIVFTTCGGLSQRATGG